MSTTPVVSGNGSVAQRLLALAELYEKGHASALMGRVLEKLLAYEADVSRAQLAQLQSDLGEFEQQFGLSSAEFFQRYQSGQVDDRMDYVEWASLVQMSNNLTERLRLLTGGPKR
jgi:hypothetical protein